MARDGQHDGGGQDETERETADEQDQAEPASLGCAVKSIADRAPLLRRVRWQAEQHACHRRSGGAPAGLGAAGVIFIALGAFLLGAEGLFLVMRWFPVDCRAGDVHPNRSTARR